MTGRVQGDDHGQMNLVASDLFFGLGAVMLVVVAALSLTVERVVTQAIADRTAQPEETRAAAAALSAASGPVVLAAAEGLYRMEGGAQSLIPIGDLWTAPQLEGWLTDGPLFVIAPLGQDTAFLAFSRASDLGVGPLPTLRLTQECRALVGTAHGILCSP